MNNKERNYHQPCAFIPLVAHTLLFLWCWATAILYPASQQVKFKQIGDSPGAPQGTVHCIFQDSKGFMWFGSQNGLHKYDGYRFTEYRYKPDNPNTPQNRIIRYIFEDLDGIIWLGTESSLDRFDRKSETFSHFQPPLLDPTAGNNYRVLAIHESPTLPGILWIGTANGLLRFDKKKRDFTPDPLFQNITADYSMNVLMDISENPPGILWIASINGIYRYDLLKKELTSYGNDLSLPLSARPSHPSVYVIQPSKEEPGILWAGTWEGLNRFDSKNGTFTHFQHDPENPNSLGFNTVWTMCASPVEKGVYWIGTLGGGLDKFNSLNSTFTHYKRDANDIYSLGNDTVRSVFQDRSGVLWVGTLYSGLYKADRTDKKFNHYYTKPHTPEGLSDNIVFSICESVHQPGMFWIGTADGLNLFNRQKGTFKVFRKQPGKRNSLENNEVRRVYECYSRPGEVWIAYKVPVISKFNYRTNTYTHYRNESKKKNTMSQAPVFCFHESLKQPGVLWFGTNGGGLNRMEIDKEIFQSFLFDQPAPQSNFLEQNFILVMYESPQKPGILWLGTYNSGLIRFDTTLGTFRRYLTTGGSTTKSIPFFSIHEPANAPGVLWLARSRGLTKFDTRTGLPMSYPGQESLLSYVIQQVLEDGQEHLWLSTDDGLLKFNPVTGEIKRYDKQDGLQGDEFSLAACRSRSGEFFLGGFDGFNSFFPHQVKDNPYIPPIVITDFKVFNQPVKVGEQARNGRVILDRNITEAREIWLSYEEKVFSFEFAALNYNLTSKNRYAYKMEGFDEDWIASGTNNTATYTGLVPGDYVFRVKGSNNDGNWNEKGTAVRVIITPPWWRSTWAFFLYIFLSFLVVFGLNRLQRRLLIRREQDKAKIREAELRAQAAESQALAIEAENRRKTHELEEARKLQLSMLPHQVPEVPGFDIAVYMKPAHEVGGDYYDFLCTGPNADSLTVAIGDATGHGLKAGMMVSVMKGVFLNGNLEKEQDIAGFFDRANRTIKGMHLENLFMALTVLKIEGKKGVIVAAGMPPVYRLRTTEGDQPVSSVTELVFKAPPLGAFIHFRHPQQEIELEQGDILVFLSDGLPELFNPHGEMFGYSRVKEILQMVRDKTPQQVVDYLVDAAENWLGGKAADDDITFVVIQKTS